MEMHLLFVLVGSIVCDYSLIFNYFFVVENYLLSSVVLPTSLVVLSNYAFSSCNSFKRTTIPT